ncbi:hypothetical protein [Crocosphaera sp. XPORK-15E]|uniref:hypothetical protein n=1 Tax=Crocosphaera sp. XPORK-15E TaxID=3110247 RepID=UPI002B1EA16C|nr:hypothetical protein [Crocosphaera sp. XPORK-15E]MEA5534171.1 hypothetical protein [Crocosphaera sp. XPORK-15E]
MRNQSQERKNRMSKGLCKFCTQPRLNNHAQLCEKHFIANSAQWAIKRCNNQVIEILRQRFYKNPYCHYTGEKLVLGVNTHLDHIQSKKNNPELALDIDNVEWVSESANLAKNGMNKDEFIQFCKLIASRF